MPEYQPVVAEYAASRSTADDMFLAAPSLREADRRRTDYHG